MTVLQNWAGNHDFAAARLHRPASIDQLRRIVQAADRVHAAGARHSFNAAADTPGDLIELTGIDPGFVLDPEQRTVTANAGLAYGTLAAWLHREGWALHNTASLPHVTLAGATATGTHGSGDALGTLSSAVAALELVTADGDLITVRRGQPDFDGMVVNLGAVGIVTRIALDIQPTYDMRQDAFEGLPWDAVLDNLDAVMGAGTSVSLMTGWSGPTVARFWIKSRLPCGAPSVAHLGARPAGHPQSKPTPEGLAKLTEFGGIPGPWHERLPHFRPGADPGWPVHLQSEYLLPRTRAVAAMRLLRGMAGRIDPWLLTTEIRGMTADDLWLSPAQGRDTIGLHFSWVHDLAHVPALAADIEALLLPFQARPHWGKMMVTPATGLEALYPRLDDFRGLVRRLDPGGKFRNPFLDRHIGGAS